VSDADNAKNKLQDLGDKAKEAVGKVTGHKSTDGAGEKVKEAGEKLKEAGEKVKEEAGDTVREAGEKFGEKLKEAGEKVKDVFKKK
jgi:uncharacterized protein YjbJ (UPF0337 family)